MTESHASTVAASRCRANGETVSDGPRDAQGVWKPDQALRLLDLTRKAGGDFACSEFMNEPNAASLGRLPKNYSVADYTRDFGVFRR